MIAFILFPKAVIYAEREKRLMPQITGAALLFLKSNSEFLVSEGKFGFSFSKAGEQDAVRITMTDKGYLISTEYSVGERYITVDGKNIKAKFFDPLRCEFYWQIKIV